MYHTALTDPPRPSSDDEPYNLSRKKIDQANADKKVLQIYQKNGRIKFENERRDRLEETLSGSKIRRYKIQDMPIAAIRQAREKEKKLI